MATINGTATITGAGIATPVPGVSPFTRFNSAEAGPPGTWNGVTVLTSNSGGSCGNAFNSVRGGANPVTFSSTIANSGTLSYSFTNTNFPQMYWQNGSSNEQYMRAYFNIPSLAASQSYALFATLNPAGATNCRLIISTTAGSVAKVLVQANNNAVNTTGTVSLSAATWYRAEMHVHVDASAGYAEAYIYNLAGTQVDYVKTANTNTSMGTWEWAFGDFLATASATYYLDDFAVSDQGFPGAAVTVDSTGATPAGAGSVTAAGSVIVPGTVTAAGAGSVTAAGSVIVTSAATVTSSGVVTAAGAVIVPGVVTAAGAGTVTAAGTVLTPAVTINGAAVAAGSGVVTASATVIIPGAAALTAAGTVTAAGVSLGPTINGASRHRVTASPASAATVRPSSASAAAVRRSATSAATVSGG